MKWRCDHCSCNRNLSNCKFQPEKHFRASTGFEPVKICNCLNCDSLQCRRLVGAIERYHLATTHSSPWQNFLSLSSLPLHEKFNMAAELFTMRALVRRNLACSAGYRNNYKLSYGTHTCFGLDLDRFRVLRKHVGKQRGVQYLATDNYLSPITSATLHFCLKAGLPFLLRFQIFVLFYPAKIKRFPSMTRTLVLRLTTKIKF